VLSIIRANHPSTEMLISLLGGNNTPVHISKCTRLNLFRGEAPASDFLACIPAQRQEYMAAHCHAYVVMSDRITNDGT
jgi:hypothetical protein